MTDRPTPLDPPARAEGEPVEVDKPERADVLSALWGTTRRRVLTAVAGGVVVAVAITMAAVLGSPADRPVPDGTMPVLDDQYASSEPRPPGTATSAPPSLPVYSGDPLWTFTMPDGTDDDDPPPFALTDSGFVIQSDDEVVGLDRAGKKIWSHTPAAGGATEEAAVRVTGALVFVAYADPNQDRWPQPDVIIALDAATGAEVWRETEASLWSVTADTIYMSVCYGGQNDHIGDCTFSARDLRTNAIRWTIPTYASSRVVNDGDNLQAEPTPPVLLIESYPTGADTVDIAAYNSATGALRGRGFKDAAGNVPSIDVATADTVVTVDDEDDNPANGCTATLTGFSVDGAGQTWQYTARTTKTDDGRECARLPISYHGATLGLTSVAGLPVLLNVDSGVVEWTAPVAGVGVAASGATLLAVEPGDSGVELVAYRVGSAQPVWRAPFRGEVERLDGWNVRITGSVAVFTSLADSAVGYDLSTGAGWWYGEVVREDTAGWFAVCSGVVCEGYATV